MSQSTENFEQTLSINDDKIANGIYNALKPTIQAVDSNIKNVLDSQTELSHRIEDLENVLLALKAMDQDPQFAEYAEMLTSSRTRLHMISQKVNNLYNRIATVRSQVEKKEADRIKAKEKSLHILGRKSETIENHKIIPEWSSPQETITTVTETRQA